MSEGTVIWSGESEAFSGKIMSATGGMVKDIVQGSDIYRVHTFTTSGEFSILNNPVDIEYLIVAGGGGGGGGDVGGGGGAGGLRSSFEGSTSGENSPPESALNLSIGTYQIIVGNGGNGSSDSSGTGDNGQDSYILVGPELVTNGTFDTDTSGWNILDQGSDTQTVSDGQIIINRGPTGGNFVTQQIVDVTPDQTYIVSLDIISYSESWSLEIAEQPGNNDLLDIRGQTELGRQRFKVTPTVDQISITLGAGNSANTEVVMDNVSCMPATYLSVGGGGGSSWSGSAESGGSGGGSTANSSAGSGTSGQGFAGGSGGQGSKPYAETGGGGAGQEGQSNNGNAAGAGGNGIDFSTFLGTSFGDRGYFAGGGGGGVQDGLNDGKGQPGNGGLGGGGRGGRQNDYALDPQNGQPNTGGGGGGTDPGKGGNGGSGIIILRYKVS